MIKNIVLFLFALVVLAGCATTSSYKYTTSTKPYTIQGKTYYPMASANGFTETGVASWYGPNFHGKKTASGEIYNQNAFTAAHKTLPFGTHLKVTNLDNGQTTNVIVNDRGPFKNGRIIDLSRAAARDISMIGSGTARVRIQSVGSSNTTLTPRSSSATKTVTTNYTAPVVKTATTLESGTYYVQVGAFSSADNAKNVANKLAAAGYAQRIQDKSGVHTVQVGPYSTKTAATTARDKLRNTYSGAFVVEK